MSSGSFKELTKAINSYVPIAIHPLPDDLIRVIQAYLDKHHPIEESDSQRLHDELLNIYQREVKNQTERYAMFIAILRQLRPALAGSSTRFLRWWEPLMVPLLEHMAKEKGLLDETQGFLLEILVYDTYEGATNDAANTSAVLSDHLMEVWLTNSSLASSKGDAAARFIEEQVKIILMEFGRKNPKAVLITIDKFFTKKEHRAEVLSFLCEFIRYGPPHLHQLLETSLFDNLLQCLRIDTCTTIISLALTALTMFLPHIPQDVATQLPTLFNIYRRLLFWDRERSLSPGLDVDQIDPEGLSEKQTDGALDWEKISASRDLDDKKVPELLQYFTFLYGLYPINFMSYIRKPERYLRHANFQEEEAIEVQATEIRQRSEPFRQVHLLHPNFFSMTIESELTDPNRWMRSDAADVVASCMALREPLLHGMSITPEATQEEKPIENMESRGDISDHPLLDQNDEVLVESPRVSSNELKDSWRNTASTVVGSPRGSMRPPSEERKVSIPLEDSPTLGPLTVRASLPPQLLLTTSQEDFEESHKLRGGLERSLPNESQVSFSSSRHREPSVADSYLQSLEQVHIAHSPSSPQSPTDYGPNAGSLRREILLLKNELNFERYLKQQHLSHIGQLRRKQVREAAAEAETQNLINSNKSLKTRVEHLQNQMAQVRKESEKSRAQSKKWETDMSAKLRSLKEEKKHWNVQSVAMCHDLEVATEKNEKLKQLVVAREAEELTSRQKLQSIGSNVGEVEKLRAEVDKLTAYLRTHEAKEFEIDRANEKEALATTKAEILELKLEAAQKEAEKVRLACNHEIVALKAEIDEVKQIPQGRQSKSFQAMLDEALTVGRLRLAEAEKRHTHLLSRFTNLQAELQTLKDHRDSDEPLLAGGGIHYHFESRPGYGMSSSPDERRVRRRGLSDPDIVDRSVHNLSSPDDHPTSYIPIRPGRANTSTTGSSPRPSSQNEIHRPSSRLANSDLIQHNRSGSADSPQTSSPLEIEGIAKSKIKPASEIRVYGRGGVQNINTTPKDKKKEKKKEDDKKDKKGPGGLRGIRGFT